jgi:hypothetical protein
MPHGLGYERAIETGPSISLDIGPETAANLHITPRPKLQGNQMSRPGAQAVANVVPCYHEVAFVVGNATHDHMNMGVVGIPVIDTDPIELRSEIALSLGHQIPRKGLQVGKLLCILRGDDKTEMMTISLATIRERPVIGIVLCGVKHPTQSVIPRDALTAQIFKVSAKRGSFYAVPDDARLDGYTSRPVRQPPSSGEAPCPAATERARTMLA